MRQLNLDQIRALIEVIGCGSFTAAAHELHLTQPAVSLQLQELESRFGLKLVERAGKRISPTPAGRELALIGQRLLDQVEDAHRTMRRYGEGWVGEVRIGMSMTALIYLMPEVIRSLKKTVPSLGLIIRTGYSETTLQGVRDNELDLGVCTGPLSDKAIDVVEVSADPVVAIFPPDTPDVPDVIGPDMLGRWPIILGNPRSALRALVVEWIGIAGPVPRPVMELDNVAGIKSVVGAGLGVSIIPALAIDHDDQPDRLIVRPLAPEINRPLLLIQRKDKAGDAAIRHVRAALLAVRLGKA